MYQSPVAPFPFKKSSSSNMFRFLIVFIICLIWLYMKHYADGKVDVIKRAAFHFQQIAWQTFLTFVDERVQSQNSLFIKNRYVSVHVQVGCSKGSQMNWSMEADVCFCRLFSWSVTGVAVWWEASPRLRLPRWRRQRLKNWRRKWAEVNHSHLMNVHELKKKKKNRQKKATCLWSFGVFFFLL